MANVVRAADRLPDAGSPAAAAQTIVSLTFDDGLNQSQVLDMLLFHNMKGTFYVNSNLIEPAAVT